MLLERLEFTPERDADVLAAVPSSPAVFLLAGHEAAEPYVSKTRNLRRRLIRLLGASQDTRKLNLRERVCSIEFTPTGSDFEAGLLLYQALRRAFPKTYRARLRLQFAPLVKMHMGNRYPRASITRRVGGAKSNYYGPFASRAAAEKFSHDALDFFSMRRCVDDLNPDPAFPGCIYSEMKMCLAPCFKGCTDQEYRVEVERVEAFFDTRGASLVEEISRQREQASLELRFEEAARLHAQLEKLRSVLTQMPEIVHRLDRLSGLVIQRSSGPNSIALFSIQAGIISGPIRFSIPPFLLPGGEAPPLRARISQALSGSRSQEAASTVELMEHLAILKRWFFRSSRQGEIFFADRKGELPWRRIVRGVARILQGGHAQKETPAPGAPPFREQGG
ncbi:MAG: UvrB/UvrC motif-containing protein [Acidobacteria bacterium]|nr:UvrB/UvrC motif-containing protein [Acidobacteriota bacterium]